MNRQMYERKKYLEYLLDALFSDIRRQASIESCVNSTEDIEILREFAYLIEEDLIKLRKYLDEFEELEVS